MTYTIDRSGKHPFIECHHCRRKSYNPGDIKNKYCDCCKIFHAPLGEDENDDDPPERRRTYPMGGE